MAMLDDIIPGAEFRRSPIERRAPAGVAGGMDWDDVRVFLAVARHGSLRAAGRALGLSQPTIGRRLTAFETTFGGPTLFDRLPEGLRLNAAGEQLVPAAESVEHAALMLERRRAAASPELCGTVRVSVGEWAAGFLSRCLSGPGTPLPCGITLELVESRQTANLARREADLAVRHHPPESGDLYIAKVGTFGCAVYRRLGSKSDAWVTYTEEQAHYSTARWMQQRIDETAGTVALRASNVTMQLAAVRAGTGRGVLPCFVGDEDPLLERLTPPMPEIAAHYSVIVHRDLRRAVCVRTVIDWIKAVFAEQRDTLAGSR
ncbi:MAG: LysR family transcriptional regulator [Alphaproteobacteria bacterium]|nr:LysR family transcriptional regulator [Alphaproteobacteria bacterium]MBV9553207.1 LysR family transcriptional regulator [Alphaproteobacteria bacterium]